MPGFGAAPAGKAKKAPKVPMKPINWILVNQNQIANTIFSVIDDAKYPLDVPFLETTFNKPAPAPVAAGSIVY
jgi:hypothetical protein